MRHLASAIILTLITTATDAQMRGPVVDWAADLQAAPIEQARIHPHRQHGLAPYTHAAQTQAKHKLVTLEPGFFGGSLTGGVEQLRARPFNIHRRIFVPRRAAQPYPHG